MPDIFDIKATKNESYVADLKIGVPLLYVRMHIDENRLSIDVAAPCLL